MEFMVGIEIDIGEGMMVGKHHKGNVYLVAFA